MARWSRGDRPAQALWSDHPPATARHQVAIGVSRLRKAFAAAGAGRDVIATVAPGYLVARGWLDARCFEERARKARDRPDEAAACFIRVLRIQQAAGSVRGQAEARYRLGTVRLRQRR